jgi:hypothetical protein
VGEAGGEKDHADDVEDNVGESGSTARTQRRR